MVSLLLRDVVIFFSSNSKTHIRFVAIFTWARSFLRISFTTFSGGRCRGIRQALYISTLAHKSILLLRKETWILSEFLWESHLRKYGLKIWYRWGSFHTTFNGAHNTFSIFFQKNGNGAQLNLDGELLLRRINKKMQSLIESTQPQYKGRPLHPYWPNQWRKNNMRCLNPVCIPAYSVLKYTVLILKCYNIFLITYAKLKTLKILIMQLLWFGYNHFLKLLQNYEFETDKSKLLKNCESPISPWRVWRHIKRWQ